MNKQMHTRVRGECARAHNDNNNGVDEAAESHEFENTVGTADDGVDGEDGVV